MVFFVWCGFSICVGYITVYNELGYYGILQARLINYHRQETIHKTPNFYSNGLTCEFELLFSKDGFFYIHHFFTYLLSIIIVCIPPKASQSRILILQKFASHPPWFGCPFHWPLTSWLQLNFQLQQNMGSDNWIILHQLLNHNSDKIKSRKKLVGNWNQELMTIV